MLQEHRQEFIEKLLSWFEKNHRNFSWRHTDQPFHILIAEMLLQKTDASKVSQVFDRFVSKYPSPKKLADAPLEELRKDLEPLGLYRKRATRLKAIASDIVTKYEGKVPDDAKALLDFEGVGDYVANSVLCFAFKRNVAILDTNVVRVIGRVFNIKSDKARARTDRKLWQTVQEMVPLGRAREFNLGLLDFASLVCTVRYPRCADCPMNNFCFYYSSSKE